MKYTSIIDKLQFLYLSQTQKMFECKHGQFIFKHLFLFYFNYTFVLNFELQFLIQIET